MNSHLHSIIQQYKADRESVYNTWFTNNEERLKAFRSIRRGVQQIVDDIKNKKFGNDFKGSSLEFVLTCITEFELYRRGMENSELHSTYQTSLFHKLWQECPEKVQRPEPANSRI
ncbi:hypothetical protein [Olivibacter sp. XZL3]|uniref:hypothetical protein n=1 Tax=Olivibacter sp. XZL3 TaxID=1735116 RepID=UPI00197CBA36|nr:hypothetical protein [Olivibacter sp. XZL3]